MTCTMLYMLETIRLAPAGTSKVQVQLQSEHNPSFHFQKGMGYELHVEACTHALLLLLMMLMMMVHHSSVQIHSIVPSTFTSTMGVSSS